MKTFQFPASSAISWILPSCVRVTTVCCIEHKQSTPTFWILHAPNNVIVNVSRFHTIFYCDRLVWISFVLISYQTHWTPTHEVREGGYGSDVPGPAEFQTAHCTLEVGRCRFFLTMSIVDFFRFFWMISISISISIFLTIAISISIFSPVFCEMHKCHKSVQAV